MLIAVALALLSILASAGVFGYEYYLKGVKVAKAEELERAQKAVNIDTVEGYIRLKNRLSTATTLLDQHIELSEFFDVLEQRTLQNVRFNSLTIAVDDDRSAEIEMEGVARNFNALAAQSQEFATEKRIKRAIFSGIDVNENGTVSFSLNAIVDPRLITSSDVLPGIQEPTLPEAVIVEPEPVQTAPMTGTTTP